MKEKIALKSTRSPRKKQICVGISLALSLAVIASLALICALSASAVSVPQERNDYPEWLITEICSDTYGFTDNPKVINPHYSDQGGDAYEFIEIYNNSDKRLNIYDYCLAYNGDGVSSASFESKIAEMTPFESGKNWIDGWDPAKYWTGKVTLPENPAYEDGYIEPGHCVVIWCLYYDAHRFNCTLEEFRAYWSVPEDVKVICFDGNSESSGGSCTTVNGNTVVKDGNVNNFNIKNSAVGTYVIARKTDAIAAANENGVTLSQVFSSCDDIVSWAVMDYTNILGSDPAYTANRACTVNFVPSDTPYLESYGVSGGKRTEYLYSTPYERSSVGTLTREQQLSVAERNVYIAQGDTVPLYYADGILYYYIENVETGEGEYVYAESYTSRLDGVYRITVGDVDFRMIDGASVRTSDRPGIRFASHVNKASYDRMLASEGVSSTRLGTLIVPRSYAEKCEGEFTAERLIELSLDFLDVQAGGFYAEENGELVLMGSVLSLLEENYMREYSARAYVDIVFDNGDVRRVYTEFDPERNSRSPYAVALAAYANGDTAAAAMYVEGVCDIVKRDTAVYEVRPFAETLDGIIDTETLTLEQNYTCRNDATLNVWITARDGKNPRLVYVDGVLAATLDGSKYKVNEDVAFSSSKESAGTLVSIRYDSALKGLSDLTATKSSNGVSCLDGVSVSLKKVYSHAAETKNGVKYYILQSCCSDGKYIYYCMNESLNLTNMLVKAELSTGKIVSQTYNNAFDHANGITYNVRTNELIIVHNDNANKDDPDNKKWISIVDADTLELKSKRKLSHKLYSCEYVADTDSYTFGIAGTYNHRIYDSAFKSTDTIYSSASTGLTKQDMSIDCEYVMFPQFKKSTLYYSYLSVFTRDGTRVGLIELYEDSKIYYEVEDCFSVAGELYFAYYCSGYGFRLYRADIKIG